MLIKVSPVSSSGVGMIALDNRQVIQWRSAFLIPYPSRRNAAMNSFFVNPLGQSYPRLQITFGTVLHISIPFWTKRRIWPVFASYEQTSNAYRLRFTP